jgi:VanZ family protein
MFFYVFLGAAPVTGVGHLHASFGLDGFISLDAFFTLGHMAVYGVLTLGLCTIFRTADSRPAIAATLMGTGVAIEVLQEEFFGRQFQLGDVAANMTGIAVALIFLSFMAWRSRRVRHGL